MIDPQCSVYLKEQMPNSVLVSLPNSGHGLIEDSELVIFVVMDVNFKEQRLKDLLDVVE